eukprot:6206853-Pleurochrysis_carterae.AAC.2
MNVPWLLAWTGGTLQIGAGDEPGTTATFVFAHARSGTCWKQRFREWILTPLRKLFLTTSTLSLGLLLSDFCAEAVSMRNCPNLQLCEPVYIDFLCSIGRVVGSKARITSAPEISCSRLDTPLPFLRDATASAVAFSQDAKRQIQLLDT